MTDFSQKRKNMVDGQIHTAGISSAKLLNSFSHIPMEDFVPDEIRSIAYCDNHLNVGEGRYILSPVILAKMIMAVNPSKDDIVLDVASGTGYAAAIMASLVSTVISLESQKKLAQSANHLWKSVGTCNIASIENNIDQGAPKYAPFDIIFMNGAVTHIPENLVMQLTPHGRLITIVKNPDDMIGKIVLVSKNVNQDYSQRIICDAGAPYIPEFAPVPAFIF